MRLHLRLPVYACAPASGCLPLPLRLCAHAHACTCTPMRCAPMPALRALRALRVCATPRRYPGVCAHARRMIAFPPLVCASAQARMRKICIFHAVPKNALDAISACFFALPRMFFCALLPTTRALCAYGRAGCFSILGKLFFRKNRLTHTAAVCYLGGARRTAPKRHSLAGSHSSLCRNGRCRHVFKPALHLDK